jgi:hypothetical protein
MPVVQVSSLKQILQREALEILLRGKWIHLITLAKSSSGAAAQGAHRRMSGLPALRFRNQGCTVDVTASRKLRTCLTIFR